MKMILPALFAVLFVTSGCTGVSGGNSSVKPEEAALYLNVDVQVAYDLIQTNELNTNFIIIDVRPEQDYASGHIANAKNEDYQSLGFTISISGYGRDNAYLIYCKTGMRSGKALDIMKKLGFRKVYLLFGGLDEWKNKGLPVIL